MRGPTTRQSADPSKDTGTLWSELEAYTYNITPLAGLDMKLRAVS